MSGNILKDFAWHTYMLLSSLHPVAITDVLSSLYMLYSVIIIIFVLSSLLSSRCHLCPIIIYYVDFTYAIITTYILSSSYMSFYRRLHSVVFTCYWWRHACVQWLRAFHCNLKCILCTVTIMASFIFFYLHLSSSSMLCYHHVLCLYLRPVIITNVLLASPTSCCHHLYPVIITDMGWFSYFD